MNWKISPGRFYDQVGDSGWPMGLCAADLSCWAHDLIPCLSLLLPCLSFTICFFVIVVCSFFSRHFFSGRTNKDRGLLLTPRRQAENFILTKVTERCSPLSDLATSLNHQTSCYQQTSVLTFLYVHYYVSLNMYMRNSLKSSYQALRINFSFPAHCFLHVCFQCVIK